MLKNIIQKTRDMFNKIPKTTVEKIEHVKIPKMPQEKRMMVDISVSSVVKATIAVILIFLIRDSIYFVGGILITFFIAVFLGAALDPFVTKMEVKRVPRWAGIVILYIILLALLGLLVSLTIPILITQIPKVVDLIIIALNTLFPGIQIKSDLLIQSAGDFLSYLQKINIQEISGSNIQSIINSTSNIVNETWKNTLSIITAISGGIFNAMLVLVITFFLLIEKNGLSQFFRSLFPNRYQNYLSIKAGAIQTKIGEWLIGQVQLSIYMAILTFIALSILGVEYSLTLALIAGLTEFIPYIGPLIAGVPALLVGLGQGGVWLALWVILVILLIQQIENNLLVPFVMKKSVGLSPVATIFAMMIGFQVLGIMGMILAIPIATSIGIFIRDYSDRHK